MEILIAACIAIFVVWILQGINIRNNKTRNQLYNERDKMAMKERVLKEKEKDYDLLIEKFEHQWATRGRDTYMCNSCGKLIEERFSGFESRKAHVCD